MTHHCIINALEKFIYSVPLVYFNKHCFGTVCLPIYVYETVNIIYMQTKIWYNIANAALACQMILSPKKWSSTPAEELSISITVGCTEFEVTRWNTFNASFSCIKWIKSEWMRYFWLPYSMQKRIDFLFPKEKKRIKIIMHGLSKIFEELYLLFVWKAVDATKITNSLKWSAAVIQ